MRRDWNTHGALTFPYMAPESETDTETEAVARYILRLIYMATDGRPREGHALSRIPGITAAAVMYARGRRWIELSDKNRVYLTVEGRRLVTKESD